MQRPNIRIGLGYDIHKLVPGRPLMLCCCHIPYEFGLLGHSDADAPVHAVIDALFGAVASGDIGQHFPDTDPALEGISGEELIRRTLALKEFEDWEIGNIDLNIIAQAPKLAQHIPDMRKTLSNHLGIPMESLSIKAKTAEKMGPVGEGRAIEAHAVVLLFRKEHSGSV